MPACPRCQGFVATAYGHTSCLNCGWYLAVPVPESPAFIPRCRNCSKDAERDSWYCAHHAKYFTIWKHRRDSDGHEVRQGSEMTGTHFVYVMMTLNAAASLAYLWQGDKWKALYWLSAFTLNLCVVNFK